MVENIYNADSYIKTEAIDSSNIENYDSNYLDPLDYMILVNMFAVIILSGICLYRRYKKNKI